MQIFLPTFLFNDLKQRVKKIRMKLLFKKIILQWELRSNRKNLTWMGSRPLAMRSWFSNSSFRACSKRRSAAGEVRVDGKLRFFSQITPPCFLPFRRLDFRYDLIRERHSCSENSGNWRVHARAISSILCRGCCEIGVIRSRLQSTQWRTNICGEGRRKRGGVEYRRSRSYLKPQRRSASCL